MKPLQPLEPYSTVRPAGGAAQPFRQPDERSQKRFQEAMTQPRLAEGEEQPLPPIAPEAAMPQPAAVARQAGASPDTSQPDTSQPADGNAAPQSRDQQVPATIAQAPLPATDDSTADDDAPASPAVAPIDPRERMVVPYPPMADVRAAVVAQQPAGRANRSDVGDDHASHASDLVQVATSAPAPQSPTLPAPADIAAFAATLGGRAAPSAAASRGQPHTLPAPAPMRAQSPSISREPALPVPATRVAAADHRSAPPSTVAEVTSEDSARGMAPQSKQQTGNANAAGDRRLQADASEVAAGQELPAPVEPAASAPAMTARTRTAPAASAPAAASPSVTAPSVTAPSVAAPSVTAPSEIQPSANGPAANASAVSASDVPAPAASARTSHVPASREPARQSAAATRTAAPVATQPMTQPGQAGSDLHADSIDAADIARTMPAIDAEVTAPAPAPSGIDQAALAERALHEVQSNPAREDKHATHRSTAADAPPVPQFNPLAAAPLESRPATRTEEPPAVSIKRELAEVQRVLVDWAPGAEVVSWQAQSPNLPDTMVFVRNEQAAAQVVVMFACGAEVSRQRMDAAAREFAQDLARELSGPSRRWRRVVVRVQSTGDRAPPFEASADIDEAAE